MLGHGLDEHDDLLRNTRHFANGRPELAGKVLEAVHRVDGIELAGRERELRGAGDGEREPELVVARMFGGELDALRRDVDPVQLRLREMRTEKRQVVPVTGADLEDRLHAIRAEDLREAIDVLVPDELAGRHAESTIDDAE